MRVSRSAKIFAVLVLGGTSPALALTQAGTLVEGVDTLDTYSREGTGPITRGTHWIVRTITRAGEAWLLTTDWHDSTGATTTHATTRFRSSDLRVVFDGVRADGDSAAVLFSETAAIGWVVPEGQPARLFNGPLDGPRYNADAALAAFAARRPSIGTTLVLPVYSLYGDGPLVSRPDTLRVTAQAVLQSGARPVRCLVIVRSGGTTAWVDEASGRVLARRGSYGGGRFNWFNVLRAVAPPQ